jgi:hypothetical protein
MPDSFRFPREDAEIWMNLHLTPPKGRFPFFLTGVARLRPEVTWKQAQAETNKSLILGGRSMNYSECSGKRLITVL